MLTWCAAATLAPTSWVASPDAGPSIESFARYSCAGGCDEYLVKITTHMF